ncbi:MAG TPA: large conductance mechanosensitive channel protein MscL [Terracidiphilus sp.]|nr:large conductance mechanosensitive channel protein MscL [Terracidiphilus sp.]
MLKGFRDFILRGNVVDLAVAVIIGAAFTGIVTALVSDIFNPLIAATVGQPNLTYITFHIGKGEFKVGDFLDHLISFLIIAGVVYFCVVLPINWFLARVKAMHQEAPAAPTTKQCPECLSDIPLAAKRCAHCAQPVPVA